MAGSSETDQFLPIEKVQSLPNGDWLIDMLKPTSQTNSKPTIVRVPRILRDVESNNKCFDPSVVSLGPYHRRNKHLEAMEPCKKEAAKWFISRSAGNSSDDSDWEIKVRIIYNDFVIEATSNTKNLKDYYEADESTNEFDDEDFNQMMFLDGCFVLYFVDLVSHHSNNDARTHTHLNLPFIVKDMFLLENQIPYTVLKALLSLMPGQNSKDKRKIDIREFIRSLFLPDRKPNDSAQSCWGRLINLRNEKSGDKTDTGADAALHLLDLLRIELIGGPVNLTSSEFPNYYFRSIMELKVAGITLCRSNSRHLTEIKFDKGLIYGQLSLPQMIVDDATKTWLLNLIAYEMCPEAPSSSDGVITSYVCFMDSLIDQAGDVKELRSKDILLNRLGSDEEVAKLFNELANNLTPNPKLYAETMEDIQKHCKSTCKVWFAEMFYTHFSSPWTIISLIAAIFLLFLTAVQTFFAVWH